MLLSQACQATSQMDMAVNYRWNCHAFQQQCSTELMTCL